MRRALLAITIAVALIAVGSFAYAGGIAPTRTFDLRFVNFCDGMRLTVNYTTGEVTGNRTGCAAGVVRGWIGAVAGGTYDGLAMVVGLDNGNGIIYVIGDSPQNFQTKNLVSGLIVNNNQTWALGIPAAAAVGEQATGE